MNLKPGIEGLGKPIDAKRNVRLMILTTMRNSQRTVCQKIACLVTEKKNFQLEKKPLQTLLLRANSMEDIFCELQVSSGFPLSS